MGGGALLSMLLEFWSLTLQGPVLCQAVGMGAAQGEMGASFRPLPFFPMSSLFPSCPVWHARHWPSPRLVLGMRLCWALPLGSGGTLAVLGAQECWPCLYWLAQSVAPSWLCRGWAGPASVKVLQAPPPDTVVVVVGPGLAVSSPQQGRRH